MKKLLLTTLMLTNFSSTLFASLPINTNKAPSPIGTYSQAMQSKNTIYLSGQIGINPRTNKLISSDFKKQVDQVFKNLSAVAKASDSSLNHIVKLTVYMTNLANFDEVNTAMKAYFKPPFPARSAIEIKALPKGASIEIEAIIIKESPMKKHSPHFLNLVMQAKKEIKEIDINTLTKKQIAGEKLVIIDVREKEEWLNGHHPQAIHLSKGVIERDIEKIIPEENTQIIVYCSGGFRSILAAQSIKKMGYTHVHSLQGGWKN